jgi:PcfJ-like protein
MTDSKPVELLRDRQGVYGIGVSDAYDIEALAWACGVDPKDTWQTPRVHNLILRPDMLQFGKQCHYGSFAVLQKITGGFRHGMFTHSREERLRQVVHHEALIRASLPWPPPNEGDIKYWSRDKKQQDRNRQIYHGLRLGSLHVINKLIGRTLREAADPDALKIARRFAFHYRELIYCAGAKSRRAMQLAQAFPVLALAVYARDIAHHWSGRQDRYSIESLEAEVCQYAGRVQEATDLIERGARLRDVAAVMQIPMALRPVKPGAAHLAVACHNGEWVTSCMPDSLPRMRTWLRAVHHAHLKAGPDFAEWAAAHALRIPVGSENEILSFLHDLADWVGASHGNDGHQFIVRPFKPTMSLRTVTKLSAEWHEAVASNLSGPQHIFPAPWLPAATVNGLDIIPIDNSASLYREGASMHHCVGTYAEEVRAGRYYLYSICRDGDHVATAGLILDGGRARLHQLRGPCNAPAPKQISATVALWLRMQAPRRGGETVA